MLTERLQVLVAPATRRRLERIARQRRVSIGAVVREAIDAYAPSGPVTRKEALEAMFALEAPVADWEQMKREIEQGALS